ncbi:unnamed protein product [Anisakis simplex]|uniref:SCP domain-containing protein n=1 Tax=Anisakis simplex TaxID=6269 RepID=A0A0M3J6N0_ANISI|nr:unnamed protein product [Anisakis simplex]
MAWGKSSEMGCGVTSCPMTDSQMKSYIFIVCLYRDIGNCYNEQFYDFGNGCQRDSDCTTFPGSKCERDTNLCIAPLVISQNVELNQFSKDSMHCHRIQTK